MAAAAAAVAAPSTSFAEESGIPSLSEYEEQRRQALEDAPPLTGLASQEPLEPPPDVFAPLGPPATEEWAPPAEPSEAEQRMHGELISKRSHVMTCRGRRMQDWLEVLDSALCLADKLAYLQRAAFSEHVKSVLREELLSGSEN